MLNAHIINNHLTFAYLSGDTILNPDENPFSEHFHNEYEFYFLLSGTVDYTIESKTYSLRPYDFLIIRPLEFHFLKLKSNETYERVLINFSESVIPAGFLPFLQERGSFFRLGEKSEITRLFQQYILTCGVYEKADQTMALSAFFQTLLLHLKYLKISAPSVLISDNPLLDEIVRYINENLTEKLSADSIARAISISPSHLNHTFNCAFPIPLMAYVKQKKILYAQNLIRAGEKPTKAAELCGFMHYPTFFRIYRNTLGRTPNADKSQD